MKYYIRKKNYGAPLVGLAKSIYIYIYIFFLIDFIANKKKYTIKYSGVKVLVVV